MQFLNTLNDLSVQDVDFSETMKYRGGRREGGGGRRSGSIMDMLVGEKRFSMIAEIVERAGGGLRNALDDPTQRVTFFAPTNAALTKFHELARGRGSRDERDEREDRVEMPKMEDVCLLFALQHHVHRLSSTTLSTRNTPSRASTTDSSWSLSSSNASSETTRTSVSMSADVWDPSTSTCLRESKRLV